MSGYWTVPPEWTGETAFILAGGPSLIGFRAEQLRGHRVIAINGSFRLAPWADALYFCDASWWRANSQSVNEIFDGRYIVTIADVNGGVRRLRATGETGLEDDPGALRTGCNSGFQAINLAYHFGAKRIVLLGYDMQCAAGRTHWHGGYKGQSADRFQRLLKTAMLPKFDSLVAPLAAAGVEIVNATPDSALTCWPSASLQSVLCRQASA
jgi:hypothetical protein